MAQVSLTVNGRSYDVVCDDGQEERLHALGAAIDARVVDLAGKLGQIGEARLLLMAALLLADEVRELRAAPAGGAKNGAREDDGVADGAMEKAAARLEALAERLAEA